MVVETIVLISVMVAVLIGPAAVIANIGKSLMKATVRNPAMINRIYLGIFVLLILVECVSIVSILIVFRLFH